MGKQELESQIVGSLSKREAARVAWNGLPGNKFAGKLGGALLNNSEVDWKTRLGKAVAEYLSEEHEEAVRSLLGPAQEAQGEFQGVVDEVEEVAGEIKGVVAEVQNVVEQARDGMSRPRTARGTREERQDKEIAFRKYLAVGTQVRSPSALTPQPELGINPLSLVGLGFLDQARREDLIHLTRRLGELADEGKIDRLTDWMKRRRSFLISSSLTITAFTLGPGLAQRLLNQSSMDSSAFGCQDGPAVTPPSGEASPVPTETPKLKEDIWEQVALPAPEGEERPAPTATSTPEVKDGRWVNVRVAVGERTLSIVEQGRGRQLQERFEGALFSVENWRPEFLDQDLIFTVSPPREDGHGEIGVFLEVGEDRTQEAEVFILVSRAVDGGSFDRIEQVLEPELENFTSARANWDPDRMRFYQWVKDFYGGREHKLYWYSYRGRERIGAWVDDETGRVVAQLGGDGEFEVIDQKFSPEATPTFSIDLSGLEGVELSSQEEYMLGFYEEQIQELARKQGLSGTLKATYGEKGLGVYFEDIEGSNWTFFSREHNYFLEEIPLYEEAQSSWNRDTKRFEAGGHYWDPRDEIWVEIPSEEPPEPVETPEPTKTPEEQVFCPVIPEGFWNPHGGPPEANIRYNSLWEYKGNYKYLLYGMVADRGKLNTDGSVTTRIKFNLAGTGLIEADYLIPQRLPILRIINGENMPDDAPLVSIGEICNGDVVMITTVTSEGVIDPNSPSPHMLDGPIFIKRYRR